MASLPSRRSMVAAVLCQAPPDFVALKGRWEATASGQKIGGTWALYAGGGPQECHGRWAIFRQPGRVVLEGTWSASKREEAWEGPWTARMTGGASYSGSWKAAIRLPEDLPLRELFESARKRPVSGAWADSARRSGAWTLWAD